MREGVVGLYASQLDPAAVRRLNEATGVNNEPYCQVRSRLAARDPLCAAQWLSLTTLTRVRAWQALLLEGTCILCVNVCVVRTV